MDLAWLARLARCAWQRIRNMGPPWPTEPVFVPASASFSSPLDVPFLITNKSAFFAIKKLSISCVLLHVKLENGTLIERVEIKVLTANTLGPTETRPYTCMFPRTFGYDQNAITEAKINFEFEHESPWLFGKPIKGDSGVWVLNPKTTPPIWTQGNPLQ